MKYTNTFTQQALAKHRVATTANLETVEQVNERLVRVVAAFNRLPSASEVASIMGQHFGQKLEVVPHSWRVREESAKIVLSGFMRSKPEVRDAKESANLKMVVANVFMDESDNSIWQQQGNQLVKTKTEDLSELVAIASVQPINRREPKLALASVQPYVGPTNTQYVAFVDPVTASLSFGARIGEDHVYDPVNGVAEIAQNLVVHVVNLNGQDRIEVAGVNASDADAMVDYYAKVYEYDPEYFAQLEDMIRSQSVA